MAKGLVRLIDHELLCKVCDLLALPHPQPDSHTVNIKLSVFINYDGVPVSGYIGENSVEMTEDRQLWHRVESPPGTISI